MIHITDRAKQALLHKKLLASIVDRDVGLRLASASDGTLLLVPDRAKAGDEIVRHEDSAVLLVDPQIVAFLLTGRTIDCRRTEDGRVEMVLRSGEVADRGGAGPVSSSRRRANPRGRLDAAS
jgi:hypothetical protein